MVKKISPKEFYENNPELLKEINYSYVANLIGSSYNAVLKAAVRLRKQYGMHRPSKGPKTLDQNNLNGMLIKAKTWQLPNGEWRESLTFNIDYDKQFEDFKSKFLVELETLGNRKFDSIPKQESQKGVCLEISIPDLHVGKGDPDELIERFVVTCIGLLKKASGYKIERILFPIGNDGLNSEGKRYTTTAGTPQNDSMDWRDSFRLYWSALAVVIEKFAEVAKVDVLIIPGNHDTERMFYIGDVLGAYFNSHKNIKVTNTGAYRSYYEYGVNMIMFTHGDKEKLQDLPLIMATEQPEMFARTKYREVHMGHWHKEKVNEFRGIKTRHIPSICHTDEWHKMMGYDHQKSAQAFLWDKETGLDGMFQMNHF